VSRGKEVDGMAKGYRRGEQVSRRANRQSRRDQQEAAWLEAAAEVERWRGKALEVHAFAWLPELLAEQAEDGRTLRVEYR
jgi:hypothetical protein